ncbi:multidrug resistance protein [Penicillium ochrochloron]
MVGRGAILRQPASVSRKEKVAYVDEVIKLLGMEAYADAVVGVPGEGLSVEQRKRLTIGAELAAKPQLLLFLDEPTSGLDSQTSWSILNLIDTLTKHGQAILCTIHQPSAMLFQRFDRLLFLAKGGKTIYFGDIGEDSEILSSYFERNRAARLEPGENPAEWMLDMIGAAPGSLSDVDWPKVWRESAEHAKVKKNLPHLRETLSLQHREETGPNTYTDVLATKDALPGFWVFMYRVSLFTYLVSAILSKGLLGADAICEKVEYLTFNPPFNQTYSECLTPYIDMVHSGYVENLGATSDCSFCSVSKTDTFLAAIGSNFDHAWQNFGLMWVYIAFNIAGAVFIYWLARVPKGKRASSAT